MIFSSVSPSSVIFAVLCAVALYAAATWLTRLLLRLKRSPRYRYNLLPPAAVATLFAGWAFYFAGYTIDGSDGSLFSVFIRTLMEAIGMFFGGYSTGDLGWLSDSSLCMFFLAVLHIAAIAITAVFVVRLLTKRFASSLRAINYSLASHDATLNVFFDFNPSTLDMAKSLSASGIEGERIVIVDLPAVDDSQNFSVSLEALFGIFPYEMEYVKQLQGIKYVLLNASEHPAAISEMPDGMTLDRMNLRRLRTIIRRHEKVRIFFLNEDSDGNLRAASQVMADRVFEGRTIEVYLRAEESEENLMLADRAGWRLLDPAVLSVRMLRTDAQAQPVHYLDRSAKEKRLGLVSKPFEALVVGFGQTGREALAFLYETASFHDADLHKTPFICHLVDHDIQTRAEDWRRRCPDTLDGGILFEPLNDRKAGYWEWLTTLVGRLNYMVVATGNDEANIRIAVSLLRLYLKVTGGERPLPPGIYVRLRSPQAVAKLTAIAQGYGDCGVVLHPFGENARLFSYDNIIIDRALQGGLMFNDAYNRLYTRLEGGTPPKAPQHVPTLAELYARRSAARQNLSNYLHGLTKLQLLGLDEDSVRQALRLRREGKPLDDAQQRMATLCDDILGYADNHDGKYPTRPSDDPLATAVCNIAVCEHLRWNAAMQLQGYSHGTVKNHLCRTHPCITGWDDLTYEKQAYDFLALETVFSMIVHDANKE